MEGAAAAATIWALVQATGSVLNYLKGVKEASNDQRDVRRELSRLYSLLCRLAALNYTTSQPNAPISDIEGINRDDFAEYADVLDKLNSKLAPQSHSKRASLSWPFKTADVVKMLDKIERLNTTVTINLGIRTLEVSSANRADTHQILDRLMQDDDHTRLNEALKWLSRTDYRARQEDLFLNSAEATGSWFIEHAKFANWLSGPDRLLFCPGNPGAGKTTLTARVVHHMENEILSKARDTTNLAYVFIDYKTESQYDLRRILRSVLLQLVQNNKKLAEPLLVLYEDHSESQTDVSSEELVRAIKSTVSRQSAVHLLVDAPDEVPTIKGRRRALLKLLHRLHAEISILRIMVTSRPSPDIVEAFKDAASIDITAAPADVEQYMEARFEDFNVTLDDELRKLIRSTILETSRGMFLWVRLMLDQFAEAHTKRQIRDLASKLSLGAQGTKSPIDVYHELYDESMRRIDLQSSTDRELARRALMWISTAVRPLTVDELLCALSIELGDTKFDEEKLVSIDIVKNVCVGLLVVEPQHQTVRLVHYTLQEYIDRVSEERKSQDHYQVASVCLTYLCFEQFDAPPSSSPAAFDEEADSEDERDATGGWKFLVPHTAYGYEVIDMEGLNESVEAIDAEVAPDQKPFAFLEYAANAWSLHARYCEHQILELSIRLLRSRGPAATAFYAATNLYRPWQFLGMERSRRDHNTVNITGLHLVAALGLATTLEAYCEHADAEIYVDEKMSRGSLNKWVRDGRGRTPMMWAAHHGHLDVVRFLQKLKSPWASVLQCKRGETVLHYAARQGHLSVVQFLIEASLLTPWEDRYWLHNHFQETAFVLAALGGHKDVVTAFSLAKTPEYFRNSIHQEIMFGLWPIHKAAQRLPVETFQLLVDDCGVSLDQQDPKGYSPFTTAVDWGNVEVVRHFFDERKDWLDRNTDQVILAAHLAAAHWKRLMILEIILNGADFVLDSPCPKLNSSSLLATAVDAANMKAAMYIAERLGQ